MQKTSLELLKRVWNLVEPYTLEYNYESKLVEISNAYSIDFDKYVKDYRDKTARPVYPLTNEHRRENRDIIANNISLLKNAIELGNTAIEVSDYVSPIIIHYSWHCLISFLNYSLFYWEPSHAFGHGIKPILSDDIWDIKLQIQSKGVFARLLNVFSILGSPTVFSRKCPSFNGYDVKYIKNTFCLQDDGGFVSLRSLMDYDYKVWNASQPVKDNERIIPDFIRSINPLVSFNLNLVAYCLVFAASSIARYRPGLWMSILLGKDSFSSEFMESYQKALKTLSIPDAGSGFVQIVHHIFGNLTKEQFQYRTNDFAVIPFEV